MWDVVAAVMAASAAAHTNAASGLVHVPRVPNQQDRHECGSNPANAALSHGRGNDSSGNDFMKDVMLGGLSGTAMGTALDLCGASVISIYGNNS